MVKSLASKARRLVPYQRYTPSSFGSIENTSELVITSPSFFNATTGFENCT
jgi:hypothetical protein